MFIPGNVFLIERLKCTLCGLRDFSFITIWLCLQLVADFKFTLGAVSDKLRQKATYKPGFFLVT